MAESENSPSGNKDNQRILVVEDNRELALVIKTKLSRAGFEVSIVDSGEAMLEVCRKNRPDFLLLDYRLPDGKGSLWMEALEQEGLEIPFLVMTGAGDQAIAVDIMKRGAMDYLIKDQDFLENLVQDVERAYSKAETERRLRRAEHALQLSEERFQLAVQGSHDGIWDWEIEKNSLWFSKRVYELLGYHENEIEPTPELVKESVHPQDFDLAAKAFSDHLQFQKPFELECRIRVKSGNYRWFRAKGQTIRDDAGNPKRMAGSFEDITQRKENEAELQKIYSLMRAAESITKTGGWHLDLAKDEVTWTPEAYKIHGVDYSTEPSMERAIKFYAEEDQPRMRKCLDRALQEGIPYNEVFKIQRPDGEILYVRATGTPNTVDGRVNFITGAFQDITEFLEAEENRRQLEEQLRQSQKMETIGTLAGGIAHDFNNILAAIYGYVALAERRIKKENQNHPALEDLDGIMEAAERAKELVQQILTFSRKSDSNSKPLVLKTIVGEALRLIRASIPSAIEFHNDIQAENTKIKGDPTEIEQVIINLCTNAHHAMEGRSGVIKNTLREVTVDSAFARENPPLTPGPYVQFTIEDNGHGMDKNTLGRIFEPFFTTKNVGEGTGMGMAVVHGIVKKVGGAIFADSVLGEGTRIDVYFPVSRDEVSEAAISDSEPPFGRGHILLVDDEEAVVLTTKLTLEDLGYTIQAAYDPVDALAAFRADPEKFDLVLTDFTMPHLNGLELAQKIHALRTDIPVLMMTGFSDNVTLKDLESQWIDECLMKPFTSKTLADALVKALTQNAL